MSDQAKRVLIVGAGGVGNVVVRKCAMLPDVFGEICLASRTLAKCDTIASDIGGSRIRTAQVDADNVPEMVRLIREVQPNLAADHLAIFIEGADLVCIDGHQMCADISGEFGDISHSALGDARHMTL